MPSAGAATALGRVLEVSGQGEELLFMLFPHLAGLRVERVEDAGEAVVIWACCRALQARCPSCGSVSSRVHGGYARVVADGAAGGRPVLIVLAVRRFRCPDPSCAKVTFAGQAEGVTVRYRRRSVPLKGGTLREPLCARCLNPDPAFWKRCASCQQTWQLSTAECTRCCLDRRLKQAFTPPGGAAAPELDRLREAMVRVDRPDLMLDWLKNPAVLRTLQAVAARGAVTHKTLDTLPPGRTFVHVRSMLVAAGALPARDERLTALERWIGRAVAGQPDPGHRQALRGYAAWHHLRRLRGRLDGRPASRQQAKNVRDHAAAAAAFLDWLTARGLTLASCTQAELDRWLAGSSGHRVRSANFVRWAVARRHASGLTAPATRWAGPSGPLDQDRRWADARRLLREEAYPAADRVAGLLVLLYAQKLSVITALTARQVLHEDGRTLLRLGSRPIVLPAPLDDLVAGLAAGRRPPGSSLLDVSSPWLFPGRQAGSALTEDALAQRLHALGISPRQGRATALFTLAADVPAAILAKTLGIHLQAAIQWQKISAGDWAAYAADVSRRSGHTRRSHTSTPSCSPPDVP